MTTEKFNLLTKSEKVVLVAKDVISQIKAEKYIPNTGSYIGSIHTKEIIKGDIKSNFNKIENCKVCALGSMLLSCTHLGNKLTIDNLDLNLSSIGSLDLEDEEIKSLFSSIFTPKQLALIEQAFEGNDGEIYIKRFDFFRYSYDVLSTDLTEQEWSDCNNFYYTYDNDEVRLIAICKNIIKNKGKFVL